MVPEKARRPGLIISDFRFQISDCLMTRAFLFIVIFVLGAQGSSPASFPTQARANEVAAEGACAPGTQTRKTAQIDPNKFAVIINGAGGEEEYAKQFEQWTKDLTTALTQKYGFDPN